MVIGLDIDCAIQRVTIANTNTTADLHKVSRSLRPAVIPGTKDQR
jgi:hypothetical protein